MRFEELIQQQADAFFKHITPKTKIRIISHLDADGLSSAAILVKLLQKYTFKLSIVPSLNETTVLQHETDQAFIISDLGSGQLSILNKLNKPTLVLDHHEIENTTLKDHLYHINPRLVGLDGNKEISGAGVVYALAKHLQQHSSALAKIAVIGALGDIQDDFIGYNGNILQDAQVNIQQTLKIYGLHSKPLVKALTHGDLYIPGVSKNSGGAERFLLGLGISTKLGNAPITYTDLTSGEKEKLIDGIIRRRKECENPQDIFWNTYFLDHQKDAREVATLLNACGRLSKPSIGVGMLLQDDQYVRLAHIVADAYKKKIIDALKWFKSADEQFVIKQDKLLIIRAKDNILDTMIGTLASILSNDNSIEEGTVILSMAHSTHDKTKVSMRVAGDKTDSDLSSIMKDLIEKMGCGQSGGHACAAGAVIDRNKEDVLISLAQQMLIAQKT
ncbi:MAG: DHHA1 domain-containing protein [Candidatus Woesearchaeota archaeon]